MENAQGPGACVAGGVLASKKEGRNLRQQQIIRQRRPSFWIPVMGYTKYVWLNMLQSGQGC